MYLALSTSGMEGNDVIGSFETARFWQNFHIVIVTKALKDIIDVALMTTF